MIKGDRSIWLLNWRGEDDPYWPMNQSLREQLIGIRSSTRSLSLTVESGEFEGALSAANSLLN
jgi:hypothetical protein